MKKTNCFIVVMVFASGVFISGAFGESSGPGGSGKKTHVLELNERVLHFEDGLIIGNGDLSVSIYQTVNRIIWRFGKNDVWDRRLDRSDSYKPVHIKELAYGIKVEGWKSGGWGGNVTALRGTKNPKRMMEIVGGSPPEYNTRPYPCPKPVGELAMQLPPDLMNMNITQRLIIEEGRIEILCSWPSGVKIMVECFIPPFPNVLIVNWKIINWNEDSEVGRGRPPVWFWLYRWPDPDVRVYNLNHSVDFMTPLINPVDPKVTPLPPPSVIKFDGSCFIEQTFGSDPLFKDGFRYRAVPYAPGMKIGPVDMSPTQEARIRIMPTSGMNEGWIAVHITTSRDKGGVVQEFLRVKGMLSENPVAAMKKWRDDAIKEATCFWSKSGVTIDDALLENLWYETLHVRRSTTRAGIDPPGLFLPSTVHDYSHWHGDYHTNYNLQSPFWGDYTANHLEIGDAYFKAMEYFLYMGRKIAHDYCDCRGVFIQLTGYPIYAEDDPYGSGFCSRLVYMTGWALNQYWWRYLYTMDRDWLREVGYPVLREGALFFTDFLTKGEDGLYHAFPSQSGEDNISGDPKDVTDQPQVMRHMRYLLRAAIKASEQLGLDGDLRSQWKDRLENAAPDAHIQKPDSIEHLYGYSGPQMNDYETMIDERNPPEFGYGKPYRFQAKNINIPPFLKRVQDNWTWYFGYFPWMLTKTLREGTYIADRDFDDFRKILVRWRHPNGMMHGLAIANYGHAGAWTESLGILGPLQEMMLQSWDGALRIFPAWQTQLSASFKDFRAEGAFLVSAEKKGAEINYVTVKSLAGSPLQIYNPFGSGEEVRLRDLSAGKTVADGSWSELEVVKINTEKEHIYVMERTGKPYESFK